MVVLMVHQALPTPSPQRLSEHTKRPMNKPINVRVSGDIEPHKWYNVRLAMVGDKAVVAMRRMPESPTEDKKEQSTKLAREDDQLSDQNEVLNWEEVEIDIGWGTMRGKAIGNGPHHILGLHGWLDNANTFDLVAGVLPESVRFVSLDLPGHGLSDHFPTGFVYDPRGYMASVKRAVIGLGWKQFTFLGHSMGAVVAIMYTAVFPEDVHALISIDIIKTWSYPPEKQASQMRKYFYQYFDNEKMCTQNPLVYTEEELIKKTIEGSKSLDERGAKIMLKRGAKPSEDGKGLILSRDLRCKTYFIGFIGLDVWIEAAKAITCPFLIIKYVPAKEEAIAINES
ncbi:hypothetical protein Pmani_028856 [Petrolisthes manimaculis]|uniref:AB hydrolase-1 domain-containing protein n=1 Tax=Petrolisthes manimaculis TaxID=1843537 RepID=A0AAE1NZX1_9EUCA|nr:hypothetical protein Pmani_028856 [Petrolisthes manimaculis]